MKKFVVFNISLQQPIVLFTFLENISEACLIKELNFRCWFSVTHSTFI